MGPSWSYYWNLNWNYYREIIAMDLVKSIFLGIIEIITAFILITALTPVLNQLGLGAFILVLYLVVILFGIISFITIIHKL